MGGSTVEQLSPRFLIERIEVGHSAWIYLASFPGHRINGLATSVS